MESLRTAIRRKIKYRLAMGAARGVRIARGVSGDSDGLSTAGDDVWWSEDADRTEELVEADRDRSEIRRRRWEPGAESGRAFDGPQVARRSHPFGPRDPRPRPTNA
jgi:hypothetical protein